MKSNKLKVLHLIWWGKIGGISLNIVDLISENRDVENYVCLLSSGGALVPIMSERSAKFFEISANSGIDIKALLRLARLLRTCKADIVHVHSPTLFAAIALIFINKKTAIIFQEHGSLQQDEYRIKRILFHKLFRKLFNQYISISDNTRKAMEAIGIPSSKIVVINNPVDSLYYTPELDRIAAKNELGIPENRLVIGTACRFAPEKDLDLFIRTAKIMARMQENVIFVLIGGGKQKGQLIKLAESSGIGDRTIFIDFRLDMVNVWRAFDVFLFTSISESFGRTLLESLSCETPIVAALPRTGGAIDIIKRCPGIINTGSRNEVKLAETALKLLKSEEYRDQLGRLGREWVIERYDKRKWIARMNQFYFSVYDRS